MNRVAILVAVVVTLLVVGAVYAVVNLNGGSPTGCTVSGGKIPVVAAENFWGSLASQLGGSHTNVSSIVTDPNADPHEYEGSSADAQAVANACLVIVNGAGYDTWAQQLISASNSPHQTVLNVQELLGVSSEANPHFWYSPSYVNDTVKAIYDDLVKIDPADSSYYAQQYASLNDSLGVYNERIQEIASQFAGTKVAATEDILTAV